MAEEARINLTVDGKQAEKSIKEIKKDLEGANQAAQKVEQSMEGMGNEGVSVKQRLRQLKDEMAAIGDIGSPRFQQLAAEAGKLKDQMNNANAAIKTMSSDFGRLEVGIQAFQGIGAAASFAAGAQLLLGEENKELAKTFQRLVALQTMMTSVQQIANSLSDESALGIKLRIVQQRLFNKELVKQAVATGQATAAQKIMNQVMKVSPIWILVSVIGAVAGAWIAFSKDVTVAEMAQEDLNEAMSAGNKEAAKAEAEIKTLLAVVADHTASEESRAEALENINDILPDTIGFITEETLKTGEAIGVIKEYINLIRDRAEAAALEQKLQEAIAKRLDTELALKEAQESGVAFQDAIVKNLEDQRDEQIALENELLQMITTRKGNELQVESETEALAENTKKTKENNEAKRETNFILRKNVDRFKEIRSEQEGLLLLNQEQTEQQKENAEKIQSVWSDAYMQIAEEKRKEFEKQKELEEQRRQDAIDSREKTIAEAEQLSNDLLTIASSTQQILNGQEIKRAKEKMKRGEKLSKHEEKLLRRANALEKAQALAKVTIDTAKGVSGAIAAGAGVPFPGNLLAIASGIASVLSGIAQATALLGEGSGIPNIQTESEDLSLDAENVPSLQGVQSGSTIIPQQKVYVVESDITNTQNNVSVVESQATFS